MGLFDRAKEMVSKGKNLDVEKAKEIAGQAKDKADAIVDQHGDKIPDSVRGRYDKASEAAEKVVPGDETKADGPGEAPSAGRRDKG